MLHRVTLAIEECDGLDLLEKLQNHENELIYEKALNIIEHYFQNEEEPAAFNNYSFEEYNTSGGDEIESRNLFSF